MSLKALRDAIINDSLMIVVLGARGSGKTATSLWLAEEVYKQGRNVCVYRPPVKLPFETVRKLKDLEKYVGYFAVIDEGALSLNARESMKFRNRAMGKLFAITRHKDLSAIFITQVSALIDINVLRYADIIITKRPSRFQSKFERPQLRSYLEAIRQEINEYSLKYGIDYRALAYVDSDYYEGIVQVGLPSFWSEEVSKAFSNISITASEERVNVKEIVELYNELKSIRKVAAKLGLTYYQAREALLEAGVQFKGPGRKREEFSDEIFVSEVVA